MDRIDIHIQVPTLKYTEIENEKAEESSEEIKSEGEPHQKIHRTLQTHGIYCNAHLKGSMIKQFCKVDAKGKDFEKYL